MAIKDKVSAAVKRADAWLNVYTGFGDPDSDPQMATRPRNVAPFSQTELDTLFNDDHIAHKICVSLPEDGLRRWCTLKIDNDAEGQGDTILEFLDDLGARASLEEGLVWARQSGGCLLVLGVEDGQSPEKPLNEDAISKFTFVNVVRTDRADVFRLYQDPTLPKYDKPELWKVRSATGGKDTIVHESRVIQLRGELSTPERRKERRGWDMSALQRAKLPLQRNADSWHALASLLIKSNILVFAVKGYSNMVKTLQEALVAFTNRMQIARLTQSVKSWLVHDADGESVTNVSVSFAGIPEAMDRLMMEAASAADMPVTKLWGRSPAGLNATGESDMLLWEAQVGVYQTKYIKPAVERLVTLAMKTEGSATGGASTYEELSWAIAFRPLRVMTDEQLATVQNQVMQALAIAIDKEIFTPEEAVLGPLFEDGGILSTLANVNTEIREAMLEAILNRMKEQAENPPPPPPQFAPPGAPVPGEDGKPAPKPGDEPTDKEDPKEEPEEEVPAE